MSSNGKVRQLQGSTLRDQQPDRTGHDILEVIHRSDALALLQPSSVRKSMATYFEPEESEKKPWETWL